MSHNLVSATIAYPLGDFVFQLVVDEKGNVKQRFPMLGWWGRLKSNDLLPFILRLNGRMDFGSDPDETDESDRYYETDIFKRQIEVGRRVDIKIDGDIHRLTVSKVDELLGSGPSAVLRP